MTGTHVDVLLWSAASIAFIHAILGPDHYIPFVALARSGEWSRRKTAWIVFLCGLGHVAGSVILGVLGISLGWALGWITDIESVRGSWAAWVLIGFGLVYGVWGIRRGYRQKTHSHKHGHADGTRHEHEHNHEVAHAHPHWSSHFGRSTPWVLFIAFVLGPCETLVPLLIVPASMQSLWAVAAVVAIFGVVTILTMLTATFALLYGMRFVSAKPLERWSHALAGLALFISGGAIQWLGL